MNKRTAGMLTLAGALAIGLAIHADVAAQQPRKPDATTKAEKSRGGADANIKQTREQVLKSQEAPPAPDAKTGEKSRQLTCRLVFDNWTPYWVQVYADGRYRGELAPWGELYTYVISGRTVDRKSVV